MVSLHRTAEAARVWCPCRTMAIATDTRSDGAKAAPWPRFQQWIFIRRSCLPFESAHHHFQLFLPGHSLTDSFRVCPVGDSSPIRLIMKTNNHNLPRLCVFMSVSPLCIRTPSCWIRDSLLRHCCVTFAATDFQRMSPIMSSCGRVCNS